MMDTREILRRVIPFFLRLELLRLKRLPMWIAETPTLARTKALPEELRQYIHTLAEHASPLRRGGAGYDPALQAGKERNVALAASRIDGLLVPPNKVFSYHHSVGRPSRLKGYRMGLELHAEHPSAGIGGGCCQVANLLYVLALHAGMKIVERHRHSLDLFPDENRQVPFGCGATVFYNYADLRFENPLTQPACVHLWIESGHLKGRILAKEPPPWTVEVYETDHRFYRQQGLWHRENRIRRRFVRSDGTVMLDREEAHNVARVLYEPGDNACGARH